jgi:agmatine/peptidylarginine deiminase
VLRDEYAFMKILCSETVLVAQYDPDETDYQILEDNAALITSKSWKVERIRQPDVYYAQFIFPVVRAYTNSLILNDHVIVPTFGIDDDADALAVYAGLFPGKTIVPLDANDIIEWSGAWHCVTMEFPEPGTP